MAMTTIALRLRAATATATATATAVRPMVCAGVHREDNAMRMVMLQRSSVAASTVRLFSSSRVRLHGRNDQDGEKDNFVKNKGKPVAGDDHDHDHDHDDVDDAEEDDDEEDDVVDIGPAGVEYGGPQRGGKFKEPTRFGDWERKGRCTDF